MKKHKRLSVGLLLLLINSIAYGQTIMQKTLDDEKLNAIVNGIENFRKEKRAQWFSGVQNLPDSIKAEILIKANEAKKYQWPSLTAITYLEFKVNGNRTNYERAVTERITKLTHLILGELIENKGQFMPQIINGMWLLLEQSSWVLPAHIVAQKSNAGLPDPNDVFIDLASGRVSADLAALYLLMSDQFNKVAPQISPRLYAEIEKRMLEPYDKKDDFWWLGFDDKYINNWNIWINTNVLKTILLVERDPIRLKRNLKKVARSVDKFVDYYAEDGACEEGPSYWEHAGGQFGQFITWLQDVSANKISFKDNQKFHRMGTYIKAMNIAGNRFVNFADAEPKQIATPEKIWIYGKLFNDDVLKSFAIRMRDLRKNKLEINTLQDFLLGVTYYPEMSSYKPKAGADIYTDYLKSIEVATFRTEGRNGKIFLAAVGGHNGVSHNHNDVGNFMLYDGEKPVIIDVGVGTYTKETFSAKRYSIWNMQSQWHNTPVINGVMQQDGKIFKAKNIIYQTSNPNFYTFSLDLSSAYPEKANVNTWVKNFKFYKKQNKVEIFEQYQLTEWKEPSKIMLLTAVKPSINSNSISLSLDGGRTAEIKFDKNEVEAAVEEKLLDDNRHKKFWGEKVYRVVLTVKSRAREGIVKYNIEIN